MIIYIIIIDRLSSISLFLSSNSGEEIQPISRFLSLSLFQPLVPTSPVPIGCVPSAVTLVFIPSQALVRISLLSTTCYFQGQINSNFSPPSHSTAHQN